MRFREYQRESERTIPTDGITQRGKIQHAALGIAGESGEVCDLVKKAFYQGHTLDMECLAEELGDLLWHIAELCTVLGMDMDGVASANVEKLMARYPDGFDPERSRKRGLTT